MIKDKKGYNLSLALRQAGIQNLQLSKKSNVIAGKTEAAYFFMVWSRTRNAFHPGTDERVALDETDIQKIADVAIQKGFLTFIDKEFRYMGNAQEFKEPGHQEIGVVFFPSHLVGRMKRMVSKATKGVVTLAPFLQDDVNYKFVWHILKQAQKTLLSATKYALVDKDGEVEENGFAPLCEAISEIRNDLYDFRKSIGIPDKHGEPFTKRQEEANAVVGDLYDLVIRSRRLM